MVKQIIKLIKKNRKIIVSTFIQAILAFVMIFVGIIVFSCMMNFISRAIVFQKALPIGGDDGFLKHAEAVVGIIAALLVVWQLGRGASAEKSETLLQQSSFIKDFNFSFLSQHEFLEVERELEKCYVEGADLKIGDPGTPERQKYIDYLVYLESLATVIQNGAMEIENVDSLMAYRFFVAVHNETLQKEELLKYSIHYRGIYWMYEKWVASRYDQYLSQVEAVQDACGKAIRAIKKIEKNACRTAIRAIEAIKDTMNTVTENSEYSQLRKQLVKAVPEVEKTSDLRSHFNSVENAFGKLSPRTKKSIEKLEKAVVVLEKLALWSIESDSGADRENAPNNGCMGIPLFTRDKCLRRDDTATIYDATIGKPSRLPEILDALFQEADNS